MLTLSLEAKTMSYEPIVCISSCPSLVSRCPKGLPEP